MALEIERKFLVAGDDWKQHCIGSSRIIQGYLSSGSNTVRVRLKDDEAFLTVKGKADGISRLEFEYAIPPADAEEMLRKLAADIPVEKIRYLVPAGNGLMWEVDEYAGANAPLFTAEIELPDENFVFDVPEWLGEDISSDPRYTNRALSRQPYSTWDDLEK